MKAYLISLMVKIQDYSKKLDDFALLTNQQWVSLGEIFAEKRVYIFRPNKQLIISTNGIVTKGAWDYLGNQSLLIEIEDKILLFKHGFLDQNILVIKLDNSNEFAVFVSEAKFGHEINSLTDVVTFLEKSYGYRKKTLANAPKYYILVDSIEHGPFTLKAIENLVKSKKASPFCFIRKQSESGYSKHLRIKDCLK